MTEFERELLNLIREAMRQRDEPISRRIIELEKNVHERIDKVQNKFYDCLNEIVSAHNELVKKYK